jgi:peptidoglycan DL-endopeptidase LytF
MNRRDTILIAVLINAGLLIILFASALTSNSEPSEAVSEPFTKVIEPAFKSQGFVAAPDELDRALTAAPILPAPQPSLSLSAAQPTQTMPMSFVDDLKTLSALPAAPSIATPTLLSEKKNEEYVEVKVRKGDVLEKIAGAHHVSVDEIVSYNHLTSTHLRINQTLKIPKKKSAPQEKSVAQTIASAEPKFYIVKTGDNPWTIAVKNHMKVDELLKLNNLDQEKARKLKPGDKLKIE